MKQTISNFAGELKFEWNGFDINEVLKAVKRFPGLFIVPYNISSLWNYLHGYQSVLRMCNKEKLSFPYYYHFGDWFQGKLNFKFRNQLGWYHHIDEKCKGDGEEAFVKFFKFYEEFSKSKPVCYRIEINEEHIKFAETKSVIKRFKSTRDYEQEKKIVVPKEILVFQLPPSKTHWFVYINADGFVDYENLEMNFDSLKERIDKEFQTKEQDWIRLNAEESFDLYNKVFITKEIPTETRFLTVTTESF